MQTPRKATQSVSYRLRGEIDGFTRVHVLPLGETVLGSGSDCTIVIPSRGVSRRHATVRVSGSGVEVFDVGSKNGTFVNGEAVTVAPLREGDWLSLGSVQLAVESVPSDDAEIAVSPDRKFDSTMDDLGGTAGTTTELRPRATGGIEWPAVFKEVTLSLLGGGEHAPSASLSALKDGLGLRGVALIEETGRGEPIVAASAGDVSELVRLHAGSTHGASVGREDRSVGERSGAVANDHMTAVSVPLGGGGSATLAATGQPIPGLHDALAAVLRIAVAAGDSAPEEDHGVGSRTVRRLRFPEGHVVGRSVAMTELYRAMEDLATSDIPVLITGETGTGKEHIAQIVHLSSPRAGGPFEIVNCAAIPPDLVESELLGIAANVATGVSRRDGRVRLADGGTLFLDEIGELPLPLQAKLLRVLQESVVRPVGEREPVPVDVRFIAATNSDLAARISGEDFRRDLYFRLAGCELRVPALRDRGEDIPDLIRYFLTKYCQEGGKRIRGVSTRSLELMQSAAWPGNVRELEHVIWRLVNSCPDGGTIESGMVAPEIARSLQDSRPELPPDGDLNLRRHTERLEAALIKAALKKTRGNKTRAAELLGLTRNGLDSKLRRLGLVES